MEGDLHLVAELVNHPLLVAAQLYGTVKLFLDLRERGLRSTSCRVASRMRFPWAIRMSAIRSAKISMSVISR